MMKCSFSKFDVGRSSKNGFMPDSFMSCVALKTSRSFRRVIAASVDNFDLRFNVIFTSFCRTDRELDLFEAESWRVNANDGLAPGGSTGWLSIASFSFCASSTSFLLNFLPRVEWILFITDCFWCTTDGERTSGRSPMNRRMVIQIAKAA